MEIFFDTQTVIYHYFGQLKEIVFLNRLYDLKNMPSNDPRYANAEEDIIQHTVNNDDWQYCWVFEDKRFPLQNGDNEDYLKFICEVFHPAVRYEKGYWEEFLKKINELLRNDGYELYAEKKISGRDAFERLKTHYSPTLDKKKSVNKIIDTMSGDRPPFTDLFSNEFKELTEIGNKFRIRHHETTKIDIEDDLH